MARAGRARFWRAAPGAIACTARLLPVERENEQVGAREDRMAGRDADNPRAAGPVDKKIGARIRARRLAIAMSQEALAHKLGVSFQQVQKYEKGVNRVAASTLLDLAEALDVSIAALLPSGRAGEAEPSMIEDADVALLVRLLKDLDAERRRALIKVARALAREPKLAPAGRRRRD